MIFCTACKSKDIVKLGNIEGYVQDTFFDIYNCKNCTTSFANPHKSDSQVYDFIYRDAAVAPGYSRYYSFFEDIKKSISPLRFLSMREEMYHGTIGVIKKELNKNAKILEVGCGLGYFTYALRKGGYKAEGLDISSEAIKNAKNNFGDYYSNVNFFDLKIEKEEDKYDAICMLELIEHVEDPLLFLQQAKSLIKEKGIIIISTPNRDWYKGNPTWASDIPEVHLSLFSEKGLVEMGKSLNLKSKFFDFSFYNLFIGSITCDMEKTFARSPLFTKEGKRLFAPYSKSRVRLVFEKYKIYFVILMFRFFNRKIFDLVKLIKNPKTFSLYRSSIIVATFKS